jgi:diguanylate cyclase
LGLYDHELQESPRSQALLLTRLPDIHSPCVTECGKIVIFGRGHVVNHSLLGEKGIAIAQAAIAGLAERSITPTPENYAVWLCYLTRGKAELVATIDAAIKAGQPINDRICDELYVTHFEDVSVGSRIMKAGGKIAAEMQDVVRGLKDVGEHTKAYGAQLKVAQTELAKSAAGTDTREVVASLVGATNEMETKSRSLEAKLIESGREIEILREQLELVKVEASTDALTGVANRKEFEAQLAEQSTKADEGGGPLSLIMCDIDFFKRINDTFGHQTGDQVIRFVASVMDRAKPDGGMVARIGGEEFAMLAPNTSRKAALVIAEQIRAAVEGKRLVRRSTNIDLGKITVSLGVAQRQMYEKPTAQVARADAALYASKRTGRNKVTLEQLPNTAAKAA